MGHDNPPPAAVWSWLATGRRERLRELHAAHPGSAALRRALLAEFGREFSRSATIGAVRRYVHGITDPRYRNKADVRSYTRLGEAYSDARMTEPWTAYTARRKAERAALCRAERAMLAALCDVVRTLLDPTASDSIEWDLAA
jgi:hypothetical protein